MPSLKCIGGPHDGQIVKFDDDQREVVLKKSVPMGPARLAPYGINAVSAMVATTHYTRRRLNIGPEVWIEFLASEHETSEAALRFALEP